eukprot:PhF_6_TR36123/c0_g1_i1/m.52429
MNRISFHHQVVTVVIVTIGILLFPPVCVNATSDRYDKFSNTWDGYNPVTASMYLNLGTITPERSQGFGGYAYLSWIWNYEAKFHGWVETYQRAKAGDTHGTARAMNCISAGGYGSSIQSTGPVYKSFYGGGTWHTVLGFLYFMGDGSKISGGVSCNSGYTRFDTHASAG